MAKSLRSSRNKTNNSKLRDSVFGPAEASRTARLSSRLQKLARRPEQGHDEMEVDKKATAEGEIKATSEGQSTPGDLTRFPVVGATSEDGAGVVDESGAAAAGAAEPDESSLSLVSSTDWEQETEELCKMVIGPRIEEGGRAVLISDIFEVLGLTAGVDLTDEGVDFKAWYEVDQD